MPNLNKKTAIQVMEEFNGAFPKDSVNLKKLKGIGDYSSAAISSFSNDEKIAVVDGNVYRVLSRIFNISTPIDTGQGKKEFNTLANALISSIDPASHNQAIMEYGATVCTPKKPLCNNCIFSVNNKIISLAGVMGGHSTACSANTKKALVECAFFTPESIIGKSVAYNLTSDAAHKFERGVDINSHEMVLRRFIKIVEQHAKINI